MKLSNLKCDKAQTKDKPYKLADGEGLYLYITKTGSKLWRMKYYINGKEKSVSFGQYPTVGLKDARERKLAAKQLLSQTPPIVPVEYKRELEREAIYNSNNTFQTVAMEWHSKNKEEWSDKHARKIIQRLDKHVFPVIGHRPISSITRKEFISMLSKIESTGAYNMAGRVKQTCGRIFKYGIQTDKCELNLADNLDGVLKTKTVEHMRSIDVSELPDFLKALERNESRMFERTRRAMYLSLHTFLRPQEIRMARWQDINFETKQWIVPAEMMKMRQSHIVPLSEQVIDILKKQREEVSLLNSDWVFPSLYRTKNPMSDATVNKAIKGLGYGDKLVAHGFRALARTAIAEQLKFNPEWIERQLAHKPSGALSATYDRTQYIEGRTKMMQAWSDHIERCKND